jgi:2',3'-cyclic-nucleotide 2'-phosphodiesterase (5'-nucleotidase family)
MREKAEANGQDLLVVDSGDRIEGNGLYDASDPKGEYTFSIFKEQHIDVICAGNHELYKKNSSENEYLVTVPDFKGNYLASNLDIIDPDTGKLVPLAPRYKKLTTKIQGLRVLAFGFIFDFVGNYNNTVIQPVEQTIKEAWFQEAIRDREVDLFLVVGHVHIRAAEFDAIYKAIRDVQWDTPIQFFGGHYHIRDYKRFDSNSYGLESGRFMETIGFLSINGFPKKNEPEPSAQATTSFSRKYIDNNLFSFYSHTGLNASDFHTDHGQNVSKLIQSARQKLKLDTTYGCAPKDLWMSRAKYPSNDSIYTWLEEDVLPAIVSDRERANQSRLAIVNTGAIRFDIFEGPFTRDSTFLVSPFTSGFRYLKDVPIEKAKQLISILNNNGQIFEERDFAPRNQMLSPPEQFAIQTDNVVGHESLFNPEAQQHLSNTLKLTPGYTTKDDAGSDGDDTEHSPINFYRVPNCIQSIINGSTTLSETETVDVVYIEFIQPWILLAFKFLGLDYTEPDTAPYMYGENLTTLLAEWVTRNWKQTC